MLDNDAKIKFGTLANIQQMANSNKSSTIILIPARMASTRLPNKPLADIHGIPMIVQVWRRAVEAKSGRVVVATDSQDVTKVVQNHGGEVVLTRSDHVSGSDRIFEALGKLDPDKKIEVIINVQGDLPTIEPEAIRASLIPLQNPAVDLSTLVAKININEERTNPNVVKMIGTPTGERTFRALYFTRTTAPYGDGPLYHHIGLYAWRRNALEKFVSLKPSTLELREKLEQLRALEAGMRIDAALVDTVPLGVDTAADLERARNALA